MQSKLVWLNILEKNILASDNDNDKDDDDANSKYVEIVETGTGEALTMLDRLVNLEELAIEERNFLVAMKDKSEKITVLNKKQSHTNDYFILK